MNSWLVDQSETDNSTAWTPPTAVRVLLLCGFLADLSILSVFNKLFSEMCHSLISPVAGNAVWAVFLVTGLLVLCNCVNEAKKLTEATEENCEGTAVGKLLNDDNMTR